MSMSERAYERLHPFELAPDEELDYAGALEVARDTGFFGSTDDPLLETVVEMLAELGHPDEEYRCVQVAGTNGKTSTARYTAAALRACGLRVALYTSPELVSMTERMEVDGAPVSEEQFAHGISYAAAAGRRVNARREAAGLKPYRITEFDLLTCAALVVFAEVGVDVAVLEVGLGGRWDATSAVSKTCACAVTGIGYDHMQILGNTLGEIAAEKAAVIRPGDACVVGLEAVSPEEVEDATLVRCQHVGVMPSVVMRPGGVSMCVNELPQCAYEVRHYPKHLGDELVLDVDVQAYVPSCTNQRDERGHLILRRPVNLPAGISFAGRPCDDGPDGGPTTWVSASYINVSLIAPGYQAQNVACALALATVTVGDQLPQSAVREAIAACPTPGRFEVVRREPLALIDACHNPQSAEAFRDALVQVEPDRARRPALIFGALADKDHRGIVRAVAPLFDRIVVTQSDSARALPADVLAEEVRDEAVRLASRGWDPQITVTHSLEEALAELEGEPFVCCGTITLVGQLKGMLA